MRIHFGALSLTAIVAATAPMIAHANGPTTAKPATPATPTTSTPHTGGTVTAATEAKPAPAGIHCDTLEEWSTGTPQVNLHHIFCGEKNASSKAVGFHAIPAGYKPTSYVSHEVKTAANTAGIAEWKNIKFKVGTAELVKTASTMFPESCSKDQIIKSIQYSYTNNTGACASVSWAKCGPSAPSTGETKDYCVGKDGKSFTIASAALPTDAGKLNTGFPIRE